MPILNPSSSTPIRKLKKTIPFQLESFSEASKAITTIQLRVHSPSPDRTSLSSTYENNNRNDTQHSTVFNTENQRDQAQHPTSKLQANNALVIINPISGRKTAPRLYKLIVEPILLAAGMHVIQYTTTHRGHATDIIKNTHPHNIDIIMALGGDGTTFEVLQGMLQRRDWNAMRKIPLVQVPGGSGNALAACCGLWDAATAVHAVVKGYRAKLDVASIVQPSSFSDADSGMPSMSPGSMPWKRFFSFLSITYGMISSLDIGTEHLRFMGGTRFVLGGLHQAIQQHTFDVRVAYKPAAERDCHDSLIDATKAAAEKEEDIVKYLSTTRKNATVSSSHEVHGEEGPPLCILTEDLLRSDARDLPPGWSWISGTEVQLFAACNLPRLDMNFLVAPDASPDSGHMNILYTCGKAGVLKSLELLTLSSDGKHMHMVEQCRAAALRIEPRALKKTWLVVDGEAMPHSLMYAEVHPGLCSVICAPKGFE